jgi:hypothetical protein
LTPRDVCLVSAVDDFGVMSRDQVRRHLSFGSVTRVNAVLLRLVRHEYLERRYRPSVQGTREPVYRLGRGGAELVDRSSGRTHRDRRRWYEASDLFVEHQLRLNDIRLAFMREQSAGFELRKWTAERELAADKPALIPDAYCEYSVSRGMFSVFIEADLGTETMRRWQAKTAGYLRWAFGGEFERRFSRKFFRVLVVTTSERRLSFVRKEIAQQTERIFWLTTFHRLATEGLLAPIWVRPQGPDNLQSLIA